MAHTGTPGCGVLDPVARPIRLVTLSPSDVAVLPVPREPSGSRPTAPHQPAAPHRPAARHQPAAPASSAGSRRNVVPLEVRPLRVRTAFVPPVAPSPSFGVPRPSGPAAWFPRNPLAPRATPCLPARSAPARTGAARSAPGRPRHATTGQVLLAAVAAGAAVPALQAVDTHVVPASTATVAPASMTVAAGGRAPASVTAVSVPAVAPGSDASAGDVVDMAALTKAIGVAREKGPLRFGRPYAAGNDDSLDGQIARALGLLGLPQKLAPGVKRIIMRESTGNPDAVNNWDSNAVAGTPSKGLMQLIEPTFRNAVLPSLADRGIYDPVANITAGVRTMIANHGVDAVMDGGLRNSSGHYMGYGGSRLPSDGLGIASRH